MHESIAERTELGKRLDELETRLEQKLGAHDRAIREILEAVRQLMTPPDRTQKPPIGFVR
jgi:hypothetical protein